MRDKNDLDNEMLDDEEGEILQDKNLSSAEKIQKYIDKNGKKIIIISLVVIVATVAFFYLKNMNEKKAEENPADRFHFPAISTKNDRTLSAVFSQVGWR